MLKFKCQKCGMVWYTANTDENQLCDKCGEKLSEDKSTFSNIIDVKDYKNNDGKPNDDTGFRMRSD